MPVLLIKTGIIMILITSFATYISSLRDVFEYHPFLYQYNVPMGRFFTLPLPSPPHYGS
jgi:hypothetical protein